jgi:hypothetical protein
VDYEASDEEEDEEYEIVEEEVPARPAPSPRRSYFQRDVGE